MSRRLSRRLLIASLALVVGFADRPSGAAEPKRVALLVGVNEYERPELPKLAYAEKDAEALSAELEKIGFTTMVMKGSAKRRWHATRANVLKQLEKLSEGLGADDVLLVALLGHGVQGNANAEGGSPTAESYFCPVDAGPDDPKTLLSLDDLVQRSLPAGIGFKIVLVDAGPRRGEGKDAVAGVPGKSLRLPANTCVFLSCGAGQESHEIEGLEHGLFTHCLLDGLRGGVGKNPLTWSRLQNHVVEMMESPRTAKLLPAGRKQSPLAFSTLERLVLAEPTPSRPKRIFSRTTGMRFVLVPKGEYLRGSPDSDDMAERADKNEKPQHRVRISKDFHLGQFEVTRDEWTAVMGTEPWKTKQSKEGGDYPATHISWHDAREFCRKLSKMDGALCRLPTSAEWELAARAGTTTRYSFGDDPAELTDHAWYTVNTVAAGEHYEHQVGKKKPNALGLYDMQGNAWEWCEDRYRAKEYADFEGRLAVDPAGPEGKIATRVVRGGGFFNNEVYSRVAYRGYINADSRTIGPTGIGFRVLVEPE